jgi:hypothetical protein
MNMRLSRGEILIKAEGIPMAQAETSYIPMIEEPALLHGSSKVRLIALVDSGADAALFDAGYADLLDLKRQDAKIKRPANAGQSE